MICGQVSDSYWFGIDWGSYFWACWVQIPSIIASKTDAKINAEKVVEISCETVLKSMRNLLKFIEIPWKTMEKSMISNNLKNLDFCYTSAVKTWFCMYSDIKNRWKILKIQRKTHTPKGYVKMMQKLCKNHQNLYQNWCQNHTQIEKWRPRRPHEAQKLSKLRPRWFIFFKKSKIFAQGSILSCFIVSKGCSALGTNGPGVSRRGKEFFQRLR